MNRFLKLLNKVAFEVTGKHVHEFPYPGKFKYVQGVPIIVRKCPYCEETLETQLK